VAQTHGQLLFTRADWNGPKWRASKQIAEQLARIAIPKPKPSPHGTLAKPPDLLALVGEAGRAEKWLRAISTWLLETDNDMFLPDGPDGILNVDPLDIADGLAKLRAVMGGE
jgi:hypothetical protein